MPGSGLEPFRHFARGVAFNGGSARVIVGTASGVWPAPCPRAARSLSGPSGPCAAAVAGSRASTASAINRGMPETLAQTRLVQARTGDDALRGDDQDQRPRE